MKKVGVGEKVKRVTGTLRAPYTKGRTMFLARLLSQLVSDTRREAPEKIVIFL